MVSYPTQSPNWRYAVEVVLSVHKRRRLRMAVKWLIPLFVVGGAAFGVSYYLKGKEQKQFSDAINERRVKVSRKDLKKILYLTGKVLPASSIAVYSPVSGQITNILVKEGDRVRSGQALFSVKQDSTGEKELESRRNEVDRARLELKSAEENLTRMKGVEDLFSVSEQQKAEIEAERRRIDLAAAIDRLHLLEESLGLMESGGRAKPLTRKNSSLSTIFVTAPRDSFVTLISKSIGDAVLGTTGATQSASDNDVVTLSDVQKMIVRVKVLESDLELVKVGTPVQIKLDALRTKEYRGKVARISQQGIDDKQGGYTYFQTDVSIDDLDAQVRAQMNASLQIFVAEQKAVLTLPVDAVASANNHAVVELPPGSDERLSADRVPTYKELKVGLSNEEDREVLGGDIKEGDEFLRIDFSKIDPKALADGTLIKKMEEARKNGFKKKGSFGPPKRPGEGGGPGGRH
jgi:multidrug efflux pump subunit AcrA (membrane-fusion protein)